MWWLDGETFATPRAPFDLADRGLLLGDGVFDTALALHGRIFCEEAHVARLVASAGALGFAADPAAIVAAMRTVAAAHPRAAIRTTLTRGSGPRGLRPPASPRPTVFAAAAPWNPALAFAGLSLWPQDIRRNETSPASRLKTLGYLDAVLAAEAAGRAGFDEALFLNTAGRVACAGSGTLFALVGGALVTPPLAEGVLAGIVRAWLLAAAPGLGLAAWEAPLTPADLAGAEAVLLTNSLRLVAPVRAVGEVRFASETHPAFAALREALARECGLDPGMHDG
ncbi:aminotransferase class IV [uncultured Methylobacterium sp.]|jgi:branched-chain amino acid aminotransferase|uniref:aminotransferase class IV n=1 Tax=uncultured Methylobacterium sp. TaxID=157278 RepID=UPI00260F22A9|nr:aminotransferase class IV [uncultured Methylobacterium sp.]